MHVYVLERWSAVEVWQNLMGDVARGHQPDSLRALYGLSAVQNAVMGSPDDETADIQIATIIAPAGSARFLFTIYENQRWSVGSGWDVWLFPTSLLPQERPAWSTSLGEPISPPSDFVLPLPITVYLPHESGREKHAITWSWEEYGWKILQKLEGSSTTHRVERPLQSIKSAPSGRPLKAAAMMRDRKDAPPDRKGKDKEKEVWDPEYNNTTTDDNGWIYGDFRWEVSGGEADVGGVSTTYVPTSLIWI